ncbi:MAG TPA: TonB-dependent receptor [Puia sp.]|jgi:outer membrane receptor protein involved in Fe transport|nr:TonB-dependent receptor [Puia sp.]
MKRTAVKCCLWIALCFLLVDGVRGQVVHQGRVIDKDTREPLEGAVVSIRAVSDSAMGRPVHSVLTDKQGMFRMTIRDRGDSLNISFVGYRSYCVCAAACCADGGCCVDGGCFPEGVCKRAGEYPMIRQAPDLTTITINPAPNASFHILEKVDLGLRPVSSAQDLLRLVPGLFIGQHQGGGLAEHIFYRGFDADHGTDVNLSVDGMPLNLVSHIHGQGFADMHFLIPELVSRFDYGKGPYYAEYGDFATAGYVAFRTADVLDKNEVKLEGGAFHTGRVLAMLRLPDGRTMSHDQCAYLAGEAAYTDGPFDSPQRLRRLSLFGKYNVNLSAATRLTATFSTYEGAWRSSGEIPERAVKDGLIGRFGYVDSAQGGNTGRTNLIVRLKTKMGVGWLMEHQVYLSHYYFSLHYDPTFFADDSVNGDQLRQQEQRDLAGYNGRLSHHAYFSDGGELLSAAGIGSQANFIRLSRLSHTRNENDVMEDLQSGVPREYAASGWLDENYHWGNWMFNVGIRADWLYFRYRDDLASWQAPREKWVVSPKFNVSYTVSPLLQFYFRAGKGFHSNDARVVIANRGLDVLPAAYGADLGVYWKPLPRLLLNAAVWTLSLQQEFTYDADEGTMDPGDRTLRKGIDLSARYQLASWLFAHADVNYCKARDLQAAKSANYLPLAVPLCGTGGLDFRVRNGLNGGLSYRYMKDRPANVDNTLVAKGYCVSDLMVNYTCSRWETGLEIQNLLKTKWREAQFETFSRMKGEPAAVDDISFTPGSPFFIRLKMSVFF